MYFQKGRLRKSNEAFLGTKWCAIKKFQLTFTTNHSLARLQLVFLQVLNSSIETENELAFLWPTTRVRSLSRVREWSGSYLRHRKQLK